MAIDLMQMLKSQVTGQLAGKLGSHLGESPQATTQGLDAIFPTVLGGLMKQVSQPGGAAKINETLDQGDYDGSLLDNITR
ncbi:DUF937 domain-containing protein [Novipirellula artificiosorum]|uniref:DUF937 domain-containing protein n=1 Tax=Novipirellula artificiosorum TaxID=2528016 RepID=A0A5C6DV52_9BACT|nr:DUF937 domain-containing protein [Novipirellula artificiosorum]TWU40570.1 hypothetical protein Poly41_14030 [Novipirellula artificiosorum]